MKERTIAGLQVRIAGGNDREGGGTGPVVVLLHGFGAPGDDLVAALASARRSRRYQVCVPGRAVVAHDGVWRIKGLVDVGYGASGP
ncbi:MAG: hypothetical protein MRJ96_03745 [Nitrospirales bacterium]|nr:hypothetical protein [Nitrospirales bacterium]